MLVAEYGGPTLMARIGVIGALYPGEGVPTFHKKRAKDYRIVR